MDFTASLNKKTSYGLFNTDLIADADFHRNEYEPMEHFANCAV